MAVITKYDEKRNPDGNATEYQQSLSITGATTSDDVILPAGGSHGFSFTTTGAGTIKVSMSSVQDITAGNGVWFDNDIVGGPALSAATIGKFTAVSAIRIVNASGTSTIEVITKAN